MMSLVGHRSHRDPSDPFKLVHLGPPLPTTRTSSGKRAVGLRLKGLLVSLVTGPNQCVINTDRKLTSSLSHVIPFCLCTSLGHHSVFPWQNSGRSHSLAAALHRVEGALNWNEARRNIQLLDEKDKVRLDEEQSN